jgi:hypothetical protein
MGRQYCPVSKAPGPGIYPVTGAVLEDLRLFQWVGACHSGWVFLAGAQGTYTQAMQWLQTAT